MCAAPCLPEMEWNESLNLVFLIIYNCALKPGFLKFSHTHICVAICIAKLYQTMSGISLLHDAQAKPRQSLSNNNIPLV